MKKTILIVEDSPEQMHNAVEALKGQVDLRLAMNLSQALSILKEGGIDGVITDICFHENGVSVRDQYLNNENENPIDFTIDTLVSKKTQRFEYKSDSLEELLELMKTTPEVPFFSEPEVLELFRKSLAHSTLVQKLKKFSFLGNTSEELRQIVTDNSLRVAEKVEKIDRDFSANYAQDFNSSTYTGMIPEALIPALGYLLIKYCLEKGIPVSFLSSTRHANHALFAPCAAGLISEEDLFKGLSTATKSSCGKDIHTSKGIFVGDYGKDKAHWIECMKKLDLVN